MSEKIQNSFYLLKDSVTTYSRKLAKNVKENIDDAFIKKLMKAKGFKPQKVIAALSADYEISLYYKAKSAPVKWKDFIGSVALPGEPILKVSTGKTESYVMLLYSRKGKAYYASTGGYGHMVVQDIATSDLGIEILARLIKPEDKALRASKERSLTGGVLGSVKIFRNSYNLSENESFGSIYNELNAAVNRDKLVNVFGFSAAEVNSDSLCVAKNSFSIKKSISFKELLRVITRCEKLLSSPALVEINTVEKLGRSSRPLITDLNNVVRGKVFMNYVNPNKFFSVEISHRDFERYYLSTYSEFTFHLNGVHENKFEEPVRDIQTLLDEIRNTDPSLGQDDFNRVVATASLATFDSDGNELTSDLMGDHYCTEIAHNGKNYFLIEKEWYEISHTMIDKINETCKGFITSRFYAGPAMDAWDSTFLSENDFNAHYLTKPDSLVFDKITPSNIEVCDILRWNTTHIYLYHVKKGFDNSMRDLCSQVFISARRVLEDSKSKYEFIGSLYDELIKTRGKSVYVQNAQKKLKKMPRKDFIALFENRKLVFVLAVKDTSKKTRRLATDIEDFNSNIAKFSLNELTQKMRNLEVDFQILELTK
ncbi:DUF6119 family protein [Pedobacter agri]|uniref:DUF6119 family protein n=1 Tax=Pedobacter agri TaxID=454586 RepID=UPI00292E5B37|nr:DUF6119 family protein [Pedobacter agri]